MKNIYKKGVSAFIFVFLLIPLLTACASKTKTTSVAPTTLTIYGLDSSDAVAGFITSYKKRQPTVTVKYKKFDSQDEYENQLINEMAEGTGPDIFYVHNTWLPKHLKKLVPLTSTSLTPQAFGTVYVNVAQNDFIQPDPVDGTKKIYALPLFIDTLALYYNKAMYEKAIPERGQPPITWDEVRKDSPLLVVKKPDGQLLERGSIAFGRADNIALSSDILQNFVIQAAGEFYDGSFKQAKFAENSQKYFEYFLSFADRNAKEFGWGSELTNPSLTTTTPEVDALVSGKVAAIVAYSGLFSKLSNEIKEAKSRGASVVSNTDIRIAPLPQISTDITTHKTLASYYGLGVSRTSKNQALAWDFIQFASSKELSKVYLEKTHLPAARRDLLEFQKSSTPLAVFVNQIGSAVTIKSYSDQRYREIFNDAISQATKGMSARTAFSNAQAAINAILRKEAPLGMYPKIVVPKKK